MNIREYFVSENIDKMYNISEAHSFLKSIDHKNLSLLELEMYIMHTASIVSDLNTFSENYNIASSSRNDFIDLVSIVFDSDIFAWSKQLYEKQFWQNGNKVICNLILNWLNDSLDEPVRFL